VDIERTKHGGSEAFQKLDDDPRWREIFKGYAFSIDYREERGHAYMLSDQDMTERLKAVKQPGACLHCHSAVLPAYRQAGIAAGLPAEEAHRQEQIMKGFEIVCAMPYEEARKLVSHPVSCGDCHHPETVQLRVQRPGFLNGLRALAASNEPLPHLPSIERWRSEGRKGEYDVNAMATRQEMRSFVCGQCHVEYYFKGEGAVKISDHHVRSPLLNVSNACQTCHHFSEAEIKARAEAIQDRTRALMVRAEEAVLALIKDIESRQVAGTPSEQLKASQELQRKAQWRLDFVAAENSMGFHAPQETARVLAEAIDYARQGQLAALRVGSLE